MTDQHEQGVSNYLNGLNPFVHKLSCTLRGSIEN